MAGSGHSKMARSDYSGGGPEGPELPPKGTMSLARSSMERPWFPGQGWKERAMKGRGPGQLRSTRRRVLAVFTGVVTVCFYAIVMAGPAQAAETCSLSGGVLTITTTAGEDPTVSRSSGSPGTISVSGCSSIAGGPATTANTTAIHFDSSGDANANTFTIDLSNGGWGTI